MATTIHEPPSIHPPGSGPPLPPPADRPNVTSDRPPGASRTGIWVALAAITMTFAAFTSALLVRQGSSTDWQRIAIPRILYLNTAILILSSLTLEVARKKTAAYIRHQGATRSQALQWLIVTLGLGVAFVIGQYFAWAQLRSEGLFLATNPNSSFFYVLTFVHVVHVLGGLGGLTRVIRHVLPVPPALRKSTIDATSYYWHFMGILWIYLLFVIVLKL